MNKRPALALTALGLLLISRPVWADITNNLVAYYNFEGLTGLVGETVVDQTGNGHNGVCRQDQNTLRAPTIVPGPNGLGQALSFDGNFYVEIPNDPAFNITDNITLAAWVSVDALTQTWQTMFCRGDWSWRLHRDGSSDYAAFHMTGLSDTTGGDSYGVDGQTTDIRVPKRWLHLRRPSRAGIPRKTGSGSRTRSATWGSPSIPRPTTASPDGTASAVRRTLSRCRNADRQSLLQMERPGGSGPWE